MKPVRYRPAPTRISPNARRKKPNRKAPTMIPSSERSPDVQSPAREASVVLVMNWENSVKATDSANTATPREMSAQFGSFLSARRKSDDTA